MINAFSRLSEFGGRLEVNPPGANLKVYNEGNCANICGLVETLVAQHT